MSSPGILRAISIYCIYNYEDREAWETLERHLAVLTRSGQIIIHDCYDILPGDETIIKRNAHFNTADVVLLILSHNFVADDLCWETMLQAMQKHKEGKKILPIRL